MEIFKNTICDTAAFELRKTIRAGTHNACHKAVAMHILAENEEEEKLLHDQVEAFLAGLPEYIGAGLEKHILAVNKIAVTKETRT